MVFTDREQERYQRHLQLPEFGANGQAALKKARVAVIGLGGLGCPAALYLAAAGVGQITLVDGDTVSLSNLQRQVLFTEADLDEHKTRAAQRTLHARNSDIRIEALTEPLTLVLAESLFQRVDLVLDCTDNFATRYLINDLCHHVGMPWVYASVLGFSGQLALFNPGDACFRCLFPSLGETPDCNQAGVVGALPGLLGTLQALMAIKRLAALDNPDEQVLLQFDALGLNWRRIQLTTAPDCSLCAGTKTFEDFQNDYPSETSLTVMANARSDTMDDATTTLPAEAFTDYMQQQQPLLIDVRSAQEHRAGNLGGINIPLTRLADEMGHLSDGDQRSVLLYCQTGKRSAQAAALLRERGLENVLSLAGGLQGQ